MRERGLHARLGLRHEELLLVAVAAVDTVPAVARPDVEAVGRRGWAAVPGRGVRGRVRVKV